MKSLDAEPDVLLHRDGPVLEVTLNRADHGNAVGGSLFGGLFRAIRDADADDDVRAIITTGAGRNYCVGADRARLDDVAGLARIDLTEIGLHGMGGDIGLAEQSSLQRRSDALGIGRWVTGFLECETPTVAAINGGAAGGGLAVALLHDVRIMARTARLAPGLVALGLAPEMGMTWILPRLVGPARAFDLVTRRAPVEADEALAVGLVGQVVEAGELLEAARARAADLAALPPLSLRMTKRLLLEAWHGTLDDQLAREWAAQVRLFADHETPGHLRAAVRRTARR